MEAKTIHRLLEIDHGIECFTRTESNTLACGLLVVDETSMVDVPLMHSLVRYNPEVELPRPSREIAKLPLFYTSFAPFLASKASIAASTSSVEMML